MASVPSLTQAQMEQLVTAFAAALRNQATNALGSLNPPAAAINRQDVLWLFREITLKIQEALQEDPY